MCSEKNVCGYFFEKSFYLGGQYIEPLRKKILQKCIYAHTLHPSVQFVQISIWSLPSSN